MDDDARGGGDGGARRQYAGATQGGALVGDGEFADTLAGRPRVDQVGAFAVGKKIRPGEGFVVGRRDEKRVGDVLERFLAVRDNNDTGMTGGAERVCEAADVIQTVGGEV